MLKNNNQKGFSLIELILVIAILGILAAIAVPTYIGFADRAKTTADNVTLGFLNKATTLYVITKQVSQGDIFEGFNTDEQRMAELVDEGFLSNIAQPQHKGTRFVWLIEPQLWAIYDGATMIPLSPLGSSFDEIAPAIIRLINQRLVDNGGYGRSWGDFAYTDINLDPKDWQSPVSHIYFKPVGSQLRIRPEEGYNFVVNDANGNVKTLSYSLNWDLVYNDLDKKWYYHSITPTNVIDITTLEIRT